jgi:hypothetical protein
MKTRLLLTGILSAALVFGFFACDNGDDKGGETPAKVATPTANPPTGAVASGEAITLSTATEGASIYYTTDGNAPTKSSTLYSDSDKPKITAATTIKAIAVKTGMTDSNVLTAAYTITTSSGGGGDNTGSGGNNTDIGFNLPALTETAIGRATITLTNVDLIADDGVVIPNSIPEQSENGVTWSVANQKLSIKFEKPTQTRPLSEGITTEPSLLQTDTFGKVTISDGTVASYIWLEGFYQEESSYHYYSIQRSKQEFGGTTGSRYQRMSGIFYLYVGKDVTLTRAAKQATKEDVTVTYRAINLPLKAGWNLIQLDQDTRETTATTGTTTTGIVELKIADKNVPWVCY